MLSGFFVAIENRQSRFGHSSGGTAQLVERQLCKLDVRGSNPLASKAPQGVRQESTTAGPHSSDGREPIPLPPKPRRGARQESTTAEGRTPRMGGSQIPLPPFFATSLSSARRDSDPVPALRSLSRRQSLSSAV